MFLMFNNLMSRLLLQLVAQRLVPYQIRAMPQDTRRNCYPEASHHPDRFVDEDASTVESALVRAYTRNSS